MSKKKIEEILTVILEENKDGIDVFERKRKKSMKDIWLTYPKKQTIRKGHIRVTTHGVEYVRPHLRPYPTKIETPSKKKKRPTEKIMEKGTRYEKELKQEAVDRLTKCYV